MASTPSWWAAKVRQFRAHLRARVAPGERSALATWTTPPQQAIFDTMHVADRRHGLDVVASLRADGVTEPDVLVAGLLIVVGYHVFLNVGTRYTTSGIAALVVALAPAMTLVLAFILGLDRIRPRHVVGLAVAFVGAAIAAGLGSGNELSLASAQGPLIVLGAPLSFALYNVILKPLLGRYDLLALTAATSLVGIIGLIPLVGAIVLIVFFVIDSQPGTNAYGPNPKGVAGAAA